MIGEDTEKTRDGLLEALESLRSVLDRDRERHPDQEQPQAPPEERVPLLDDVVDGALHLDEAPLNEPLQIEDDPERRLDDELFNALLTDSWKASAAEILKESRADIEQHRSRWLPEDTDRLNSALKTRIDDTLRSWLREVLRRNVDELHTLLLQAIEEQLREQIAEILEASDARRRG